MAHTTKSAAQRLRMGLAALGLARGAVGAAERIRGAVRRRGQERGGGSGGRLGEGTYGSQTAAWETE